MLTASSPASARVPAMASTNPTIAPLHESTIPSVSICASEPPSPGSERHPDRDLLLARRRPREQQVRQVRAHDQHHHADGAGEHPHGEPDPSADLIRAAA